APFWLVADGLRDMGDSSPPPRDCDVVVIGAGITGALVADTLAQEGLSVVVLDRRAPACGSTAASTSLISYEIDVSLKNLAEMIGEEDAVRSYRLSLDAVHDLGTIAASLSEQTGFAPCPSICLASHRKHRRDLEQEVALRQRHDLDAEFWTAEIVEQTYGFPSHGALHTGTAGVLDPVRFTRALLDRAVSRGAALLPRTPARDVRQVGTTLAVVTGRGTLRARSVPRPVTTARVVPTCRTSRAGVRGSSAAPRLTARSSSARVKRTGSRTPAVPVCSAPCEGKPYVCSTISAVQNSASKSWRCRRATSCSRSRRCLRCEARQMLGHGANPVCSESDAAIVPRSCTASRLSR